MKWCDENGIDFIFGLPGNAVLDRLVDETVDDIRTGRRQGRHHADPTRHVAGRHRLANAAADLAAGAGGLKGG